MKAFFYDLITYNNQSNDRIIAAITKNPGHVTDKCISLLSHVLNAHRIWNYKIQPGPEPFDPWELHSIREIPKINRANHEESVMILDGFELDRVIQYTTRAGQTFSNPVQDILFHVINHSTYHRGQIATEFRNAGMEPLLTDYIFYKMK